MQDKNMWTRYYDAATEAEKEQHNEVWRSMGWSISGKPPGLYMAHDDEWIKWYREHGNGLSFNYTHKKKLLNLDAFKVLELNMDNFLRYVTSIPYFQYYKEIDWQKVYDEGFDGVHITQSLIDHATCIWRKHNIHFGGYDVETLVIWASSRKQKMEWTSPISIDI